MTHRDVTVGAHDEQEDGRGKLCDRRTDHVGLAHPGAEGPFAQVHRGDQKRNADQKALISKRQIQNVHIGDCLHFGEPQHNVDDQCVAKQANYADYHVQYHRDEVAHGHLDRRAGRERRVGVIPAKQVVQPACEVQVVCDQRPHRQIVQQI
jgi:hypothetical protein